MQSKKIRDYSISLVIIFFQIIALLFASALFAYPVEFTDYSGKNFRLGKRPVRVVSLVPSITEIIVKIGAGDALKGITYHSTNLPGATNVEVVGGFYSPDIARIEELEPDLIFYSSLQKEVYQSFAVGNVPLINLETLSLADSYRNILLLGNIFNADKKAQEIVRDIKDTIAFISEKTKMISDVNRKRVIRVMGLDNDTIIVPGDNSFQNEMISDAGGIPPRFGKNGQAVTISSKEWAHFNPQLIYTCGGNKKAINDFLSKAGWNETEAVKENRMLDFPCDLTCRAATNTGYFISWLSAGIYHEEFKDKEMQVSKDHVTGLKRLVIPLPYLKDAQIYYSSIRDFQNKTLVVDFNRPMSVLSTLDGFRVGIKSVANHYSSPPCWSINHDLALNDLNTLVLDVIKRPSTETSMLFTGADIDNLSVQKSSYKEMDVYALITAGVSSNAVRMSQDIGQYYEPGTVNIILMTNMRLTQRAMARAIISATEAKTAAIQDMDIRSSYTPSFNQATGTGTDNIIVVEGEGTIIDSSGGHSKMGELIAKAVYNGVKEAVCKQNGIVAQRNIFQRLAERKIDVSGLISFVDCDCGVPKDQINRIFEKILLEPEYSSFLSCSIAISDDYEKGLIKELGAYELWCLAVAEDIAFTEMERIEEIIDSEEIPVIIRMSLNAILTGIIQRLKQE